MALDDVPVSYSSMNQKMGKKIEKDSWAQKTAQEMDDEENDAGAPHELTYETMKDVERLS